MDQDNTFTYLRGENKESEFVGGNYPVLRASMIVHPYILSGLKILRDYRETNFGFTPEVTTVSGSVTVPPGGTITASSVTLYYDNNVEAVYIAKDFATRGVKAVITAYRGGHQYKDAPDNVALAILESNIGNLNSRMI